MRLKTIQKKHGGEYAQKDICLQGAIISNDANDVLGNGESYESLKEVLVSLCKKGYVEVVSCT